MAQRIEYKKMETTLVSVAPFPIFQCMNTSGLLQPIMPILYQ